MNAKDYLRILHTAEKLKDTPRHCTTSQRRTESVAEHSWRVSLMAYLLKEEFPDADMDKVVSMCLIHDLGECFTGDIPTFNKTNDDRDIEDSLLNQWIKTLPFTQHDAAIVAHKYELASVDYINTKDERGTVDMTEAYGIEIKISLLDELLDNVVLL